MGITAPVAMVIGSMLSAGASIHSQQQASQQAKKARAAQKKALEEQRVLDAASEAAMLRQGQDDPDIELDGDLQIGARSGKRRVKNGIHLTDKSY